MNEELFSLISRVVYLTWTVGVLLALEASAQTTYEDATRNSAEEPSYFFYQQSNYPRDCHEVDVRCSSDVSSSGVYYIKPDGYREPFEVYCESDEDSGGWTMIQNRHINGSVEFNRNWASYRGGFGFLSHDFWLGNEKLAFLTNQKNYELLIKATTSNGTTIAVSYNNFRIGDEHNAYRLTSLVKNYIDNAQITWYPVGNCTCGKRTCEAPATCINTCVEGESEYFVPCPEGFYMKGEDCVPQTECGCYVEEDGIVVPEGDVHMSLNCTRGSSCTNQGITVRSFPPCGTNAECAERNNSRQCLCDDGFTGNGQICRLIVTVTDCQDLHDAGIRESGVYTIKPTNWNDPPFDVYCNMTDDKGWTVLQRRTGADRQVNFYRNWTSYRDGFGSLSGDLWLGNEKIHYLTNQKPYKLRVDAVGSSDSAIYGEWSTFSVGTEDDKYRLTATGHSGNTASMGNNNGKMFSTYDQDNDACGTHHCAVKHRGGWWYYENACSYSYGSHCYYFVYGSSNTYCTYSNPNGDYNGGNGENIFFQSSHSDYCNLKFVEMKILPKN